MARTGELQRATIDRLVDIYGSRASDIIGLGQGDPALFEPVDPATGAIGAELLFTYVHEFARTLTDVLVRRTMIGLNDTCGIEVVERAADLMAPRLGWNQERRDSEVAAYRRYIERFAVPGQSHKPSQNNAQVQ